MEAVSPPHTTQSPFKEIYDLGFDAISALPFATGPDTDVSVSVTGNSLNITIGSVGIIADAVMKI